MKKNIEDSIKRFVELSLKFTKKEEDIFSEEELVSSPYDGTLSGLTFTSTCGTIASTSTRIVHEVYQPEPTRGETILERAKERATLADEYDEYIKLRKALQLYFKAEDELTNK